MTTDRLAARPGLMLEHEDYYGIVDEAFVSKHQRLISNGRPEHAAYLLGKFFQNAESRISLFSGKLAQNVRGVKAFASDNIITAARRFLQRPGSELDVILANPIDVAEGEDPTDHPFVSGIQYESDWGFLRGRFDLRQAAEVDRHGYHFLVMDETACRVETDTDKVEAVVALHDAELCVLARSAFDRMLARAEPILSIR